MPDDHAFRFDCGAPWLNLLATRGRSFGAHPVERVPTTARLADWLARTELTPVAPVTEDDVARTHRLREVLRALALPVAGGGTPPAEAVRTLGGFLTAEPVRFAPGGGLRRTPPPDTAAALARLAGQAADHLTGPLRHDLRICPERDCRGVFSDPGGRRHWCPSPACASRGRVRALRQRRREGS